MGTMKHGGFHIAYFIDFKEGRQYVGSHIWLKICHINSIFAPEYASGERERVHRVPVNEKEAKQNGSHHIWLERFQAVSIFAPENR